MGVELRDKILFGIVHYLAARQKIVTMFPPKRMQLS